MNEETREVSPRFLLSLDIVLGFHNSAVRAGESSVKRRKIRKEKINQSLIPDDAILYMEKSKNIHREIIRNDAQHSFIHSLHFLFCT